MVATFHKSLALTFLPCSGQPLRPLPVAEVLKDLKEMPRGFNAEANHPSFAHTSGWFNINFVGNATNKTLTLEKNDQLQFVRNRWLVSSAQRAAVVISGSSHSGVLYFHRLHQLGLRASCSLLHLKSIELFCTFWESWIQTILQVQNDPSTFPSLKMHFRIYIKNTHTQYYNILQ